PRHCPLHLRQKHLAPRPLALASVFNVRKTQLLHHSTLLCSSLYQNNATVADLFRESLAEVKVENAMLIFLGKWCCRTGLTFDLSLTKGGFYHFCARRSAMSTRDAFEG